MKKSAVVGGSMFLVGCLIFCVSMGVLNWDFTKLSNRPPFEEKTMVLENSNQTIALKSSNVEIHVAQSQDDKIHLIYSEREKEGYEFDQGNTITIKKSGKYQWYEHLAVMDFHKEDPFIILLPIHFAGELDLTTSNAKVELKDVSLQNMVATTSNDKVVCNNVTVLDSVVVTTSNHAVDFSNLQANGRIELTTKNGSVHLTHISAKDITARTSNDKIFAKNLVASNDINFRTTNNSIVFDSISAKESITLSTNNHKIEGVLPGKMSDYNITSKTSHAENSLPERMPDGQTKLDVSTTNGDIDILFDNH